MTVIVYLNDPNVYLDRQVQVNSVDPDHIAP